jgi:hypothetical protein
MNHDRIHAREPTHDVDEWSVGTIRGVGMRDGHAVFTVAPDAATGEGSDGTATGTVELTVTTAVRDLVLRRLPGDGEDPVGQRVWYSRRGR